MDIVNQSNSSTLFELYEHYLQKGDPRVANWVMMDTPMKTIGFMFAYLASLRVIKQYMADKKPFELRYFLIFYNFLQVCGSFYIFSEILIVAYLSNYSLTCQTVDYSNDPLAMRMLNVLWCYYMSKLVDFIDTIVFALRKKDNQITFLHVFHHFTMFPFGWIGVKYVGGGQTFFLSMLNSFIHTIMYSYYGLSALGPAVQKHLWWKKYLTQMQLAQFFAVMAHSLVNVYTDCSFPKAFSLSFLSYGVVITGFFANFYVQSYLKKRKENSDSKKTSKQLANGNSTKHSPGAKKIN